MVYHEVELTCSTSSQTSLHSFAMKKVKRGTRMKTKSKVLTVIVSALLLFSFVSCVTSTNVTFYSDVEETEVYVDGQLIGTTPTTTKLSNAIWNDPNPSMSEWYDYDYSMGTMDTPVCLSEKADVEHLIED